MLRRTLILGLALTGPAWAQALPAWARLDGASPVKARPTASAVVEVIAEDPAATDRAIQMRLVGEIRDALRFAPGSLGSVELGAFMAEAWNPFPDFSKAQLNATMDYWMPRPFHLDGLSFGSKRLSIFATATSGSSDTSRRGPIGR